MKDVINGHFHHIMLVKVSVGGDIRSLQGAALYSSVFRFPEIHGSRTKMADSEGNRSTQTSPMDENSENPAPQFDQDLKSVLLTSVLNLEKLDVDLYR